MADRESRIADPITYYDEFGEGEWERLESGLAGELEFENTVAELQGALPDEGAVLDAGGGAGRYTAWLREHGYDATLLDASTEQLAVAREKIDAAGDPIGVVRGSIHRLPFERNRFDATLCLGGPLSHLVEEQRRREAASELRRVTAPGGSVIVSVMGRLHVLLLNLQAGRRLELLADIAREGTYDADLLERHDATSEFVACHFFRAAELQSLLEWGGLSVERVVGLEGLASVPAEMGALEDVEEAERVAVKTLVEELRNDDTVADLSAHLLAVCEA